MCFKNNSSPFSKNQTVNTWDLTEFKSLKRPISLSTLVSISTCKYLGILISFNQLNTEKVNYIIQANVTAYINLMGINQAIYYNFIITSVHYISTHNLKHSHGLGPPSHEAVLV